MAQLQITQVRSVIGAQRGQRATIRSLGLRRMHHTVTQPDRPEIRGMVAAVAHLVRVRYVGQDEPVELEPGQQPKGIGQPPAGPSVADEQAAELRAAQDEALEVTGEVAASDLVQNPPSLTSTDAPDAPKAPATSMAEEATPGQPQPDTDDDADSEES